RSVLSLDLDVPGLEDAQVPNRVTVVTAHIEDKASAACRADQVKETLDQVKDRKNPVILAGDFNTFGSDGRPQTVERMLWSRISSPEWIVRQLTGRLIPYAGLAWTIDSVINFIRKLHDPTVANIPFILPNPERGFFDAVEKFKFPDGGRFDFRGDKSCTANAT